MSYLYGKVVKMSDDSRRVPPEKLSPWQRLRADFKAGASYLHASAMPPRRNDPVRLAQARDIQALAEEWDDEASEHALAGNPQRAHYLHSMSALLLRVR